MRSPIVALVLVLASPGALLAQALTCPPVAGRPCDTYHFHVSAYRPDTRTFVELTGINQFASQTACDRARDLRIQRNAAVIDALHKTGDQQYPADRVGPCHCDQTFDRESPTFIPDATRLMQLKVAEEIRQRVRERLLDAGLPSDSDVVRGLMPAPMPTVVLGGPKLVPLPPRTSSASVTNPPTDLKSTKVDPATQAQSTLDLPLVEIGASGTSVAVVAPAPAPAPTTATTTAPPPATPAPPAPVPAARPVAEQQPAPGTITITSTGSGAPLITNVAPSPAPGTAPPMTTTVVASPDDAAAAEDAAESFVGLETQRIQKVLAASTALTDENTKTKVFEACMQRLQLLSNLRSLIQGSGARSRLASAARKAKTEEDRMQFVARLFGDDMPKHWAPKDAADVVLDSRPELDGDTEKVLRDPTHFNEQQRKRALYLLLARTQPTEEQQLWLGGVVEGFLQ